MDISIVLPVINERANLSELIPHLKSVLEREGLTFETVVVDGGSTDGTREAAQELGARVVGERRKGYAGAIETGLDEARGDYVLTLDADLSHDPNFVARMWRARTLADIVIASRYVRGGASHGPLVRKEMSRLLNEVYRLVLLMPVRDLSSGFRLYRRTAIEGIKIEGNSFEVQQELLAKAYSRGFSIVEVPFTYFPRGSGRSHAHILRLGVGYARSTFNLRKLRDRHESADYDERMFYTLRPIRRLIQRRRHGLITGWARSSDRTLTVGCGSDIVTQSLNHGIGMDRNLGKLRFIHRYGVAAVCASADAIPFRDGSFDCLIGSPNIDGAPSNELREMHRVLRADGTLIFVTPRAPARSHHSIVQKLAQNGFAVEEGPIATYEELLARCRRVELQPVRESATKPQ